MIRVRSHEHWVSAIGVDVRLAIETVRVRRRSREN